MTRQILLTLVCGLISGIVHGQSENERAAKFTENAMKLREEVLFKIQPSPWRNRPNASLDGKYPWHDAIVTTVFWVGEMPSGNNPVPNHVSAWDLNWARNFGGTDNPESRRGFIPASFVPRQNPFYLALPYNDVSCGRTKPEASQIIPWFKSSFVRFGQTVLKDRWVAIRKGEKICYAQWEDVGPFRTDHAEYVFGSERPRPNLNRGAGLDVSPAVRDYLGLSSTDLTDWKFVEFTEVPPGPWGLYGDNNTFVLERHKREEQLARRQ
jgi:hypothetical protein